MNKIALIFLVITLLGVQTVYGQTPDTESESTETSSEEQVVENDAQDSELETPETPVASEDEADLEVEESKS